MAGEAHNTAVLEFGIMTSQGSGVVAVQGLLLSYVGQVFSILVSISASLGLIHSLNGLKLVSSRRQAV
jgi:hypothetical protein